MRSVDEIREAIERQPLRGLIVSQAGEEICREPARSRRVLVHSVAKSVAVRVEGAQGTEAAKEQLRQLKRVRVKHPLSNSSGFRDNFLTGFQRPYLEDADWLAQCLCNPVTSEPGTRFELLFGTLLCG